MNVNDVSYSSTTVASQLNAKQIALTVVGTELAGLRELQSALPGDLDRAVSAILATSGRVIVTGVGKSGHVARKLAATLASTGTPAQFIHPVEAGHGDLGMVTPSDLCLALSNSGETGELSDVIAYCARFGVPLIGMTSNASSTLAAASDYCLALPDATEACAVGMAPTTSTTIAMVMGDALAVCLMHAREFGAEQFREFHPGGTLGARLLTVGALMHQGDALPVVGPEASMGETLITMTSKSLGIAIVVTEGRLEGVITDGDLRRNLTDLLQRRAGEISTEGPLTVTPEILASEAVRIMNKNAITVLCVTDSQDQLVGVLHLHDCLREGVA